MAGERLRGVELFASGVYRGKPYTFADVDAIAANARLLGPKSLNLLAPPAVVGHEEEDADGNPTAAPERTDVPADGWVDPETVKAVWRTDRTGTLRRVLVGDLTDLDPETAAKIKARRLRKVSAEIYDDFADDRGKSYGKALRRVAFLGGEVPQVKGLADLPMPTAFAERLWMTPAGGRPTGDRTFCAFSEVFRMDRAAAIAAIMAAMPGIQQPTLDAMSDDMLADLAKNLPAAPATPATPMSDSPAMTRDEMIAKLAATGQDPTMLATKTDDELKAMCNPAPTPAATPMSDKAKAADKFAEETVTLAKRARDKAAATLASLQKQDAEKFCEQLVREGRLLPVQKPRILADLIAQDDTHAVHKFTENGSTTNLTAFEKAKREYAAWPVVVKFGEKVPSGDPADAKAKATAEVRKVEKFCEMHGATIKAHGTDPARMVATAKKLAETNPDFQAADLIGKDAAASVA